LSAASIPGGSVVSIEGPVTRAEAGRWRSVLLDALAAGPDLRLNLAGSGPWDLAGLQLALAALASARRAGGTLRLLSVPPGFWSIVEQAGVAEALEGSVESWQD
jgi:anti-anti-sigma regulatory factor